MIWTWLRAGIGLYVIYALLMATTVELGGVVPASIATVAAVGFVIGEILDIAKSFRWGTDAAAV